MWRWFIVHTKCLPSWDTTSTTSRCIFIFGWLTQSDVVHQVLIWLLLLIMSLIQAWTIMTQVKHNWFQHFQSISLAPITSEWRNLLLMGHHLLAISVLHLFLLFNIILDLYWWGLLLYERLTNDWLDKLDTSSLSCIIEGSTLGSIWTCLLIVIEKGLVLVVVGLDQISCFAFITGVNRRIFWWIWSWVIAWMYQLPEEAIIPHSMLLI